MFSKFIIGLLIVVAAGYICWRNGHRTGVCSSGSCSMQVLLDCCHKSSPHGEPEYLDVMPREVPASEIIE